MTGFLSGVVGIHCTPPVLYSRVSTPTTALSSVYQYKSGHFYRLVRLALNKECWVYSGLVFFSPYKNTNKISSEVYAARWLGTEGGTLQSVREVVMGSVLILILRHS